MCTVLDIIREYPTGVCVFLALLLWTIESSVESISKAIRERK